MKFFCFTFLILSSQNVHSFNYEECKEIYNAGIIKPRDLGDFHRFFGPFSITYMPITYSAFGSTGTSSTFQFTSSQGECKAYDFNKLKITNFMNANLERLRVEFSQGNGENIEALNSLIGCEDKKLMELIRLNYQSIFYLDESPTNVSFIKEAIFKVAENDNINKYTCKNINSLIPD